MGLRLFGVTPHEAHSEPLVVPGAELVTFRDLAAVVEDAPYEAELPGGEVIERYDAVVESVFARRVMLPAPVGVVFRSNDVLVRWMELHYVALSDAIAFVEDRAVARVYLSRANATAGEQDTGSDLAATAAESFRTLRRRAVAALPLKTEHLTGIVLSCAYLVERELWKEFTAIVSSEAANNPELRFDLTGPWPPYDFVRMQFGV